jgi:hypothetical protein
VREERGLGVVEDDALFAVEPARVLVDLGDDRVEAGRENPVSQRAFFRVEVFALPGEVIIDNTPAFLAERAPGVTRNLVLLTQPRVNHLTRQLSPRLYIAPAEPLQVKTWDYTRPHLLEATIARGELDAGRYAPLLDQFLGSIISFELNS